MAQTLTLTESTMPQFLLNLGQYVQDSHSEQEHALNTDPCQGRHAHNFP